MVILWVIFGVVFGTIWLWLPILIIVLVVRGRKKAAPVAQVGEPLAAGQQVLDRYVVEREGLNQKIYAEIKSDAPNVAELRRLVKEIEELSVQRVEAAPAPGMAGYSYAGAALGGSGQQVAAAPTTIVSTPAMAEKENHSGLNAILYIGSLLVVAGVGSLVAAALDDSVKMVVMLVIIGIFYVGGLLVRRDERLVIAGKALVGTALAIIPFLGFGFAGFLDIPAEFAWLFTSIIGLFAYVLATILLKSQVIAFLSMAFLISLCLSMSATLALPMLYYFMLVMIVGIVAGLVRLLAGGKVPELFSLVVDVTGRWLTLATLAASLVFVWTGDTQMYVWLFWIAAVQTAIMWAGSKSLREEILFRLFAHAAVLVTCLEVFSGDEVAFGAAFLVMAILHGLISLVLGALGKGVRRRETEWGMLITMVFLAQFATVFVMMGDEGLASVICLIAVSFAGIISGVSAAVYKKTEWLYGVLAAMVALPLVLGIWVVDVRWSLTTFYVIYLVEMVLAVGLRALAGKRPGCDALGLTGVVVFGGIAVGCSIGLEAGYQVMGMALWTAAVGMYGWLTKRKVLYEIAVYLGTLTLCRGLGEVLSAMRADDWTCMLTYAHVLALTLVGTSVWREKGETGKIRLGCAMGILTAMVGARALSAGDYGEMMLYPMWFLVMNVVFVVVGGLWKKKWMWVWGAVGVGLTVMWFVRDMAFIWLILLGFGLIGLVVWSLLKANRK